MDNEALGQLSRWLESFLQEWTFPSSLEEGVFFLPSVLEVGP